MHDPMTVAFRINVPFTGKKNEKGGYVKYPNEICTIWHVDPCKDGSDDSCGWFIRARHVDKEKLADIESRFRFEWEYIFYENGTPKFSPGSITLMLFGVAAYEHFRDWKKSDRFMQKHLAELLHFAENPTDSIYDEIMGDRHNGNRDERIHHFATVIYPYILRKLRPWWKHPRWHIHHWYIQINMLQHFKRWAFSRCAGCGKGFKWGYAPISTQWDNDGPRWFRSERNIYHHECSPHRINPAGELAATDGGDGNL